MKPIIKFFRGLFGLRNDAKITVGDKLSTTASPTPITSKPQVSTKSPFFCGRKNDLFSDLGLQTAIEYYNQKYPERGQIHCVYQNLQFINDDVTEQFLKLKKSKTAKKNHEPIKIVLSVVELDQNKQRLPYHSHPFILTEDKLISLRTLNDSMAMYQEIAENIGVKLVKPASSYKSIQADSKSCHFIALGILKDLTKADLEKISTFENGFKPLAKSLKYSQSGTYIETMLTEDNKDEEVKKGLTADEYRKKYQTKNILDTRIVQKEEKFRNRLKNTSQNNVPKPSPKLAASELLGKEKPGKTH
ncbi:MAG: hypothetical protein V4694_07335 [Pseudomonadota bacterium]